MYSYRYLLLYLTVATITTNCCKYYEWNPLLVKKHLHITILVLARGGSQGIKLKNISTVGGVPLLSLSLRQIKAVNAIDSIWVSTDHLKISAVAEKENVNIHWRSPESASETATSLDGVKEFLKYHPEVDALGLVQCTSPFIKFEYLQRAVDFMNVGEECVFSVTRSHKLLWREIENKLKPINFNPSNRMRRQDWIGDLVENGMFYFATKALLNKGLFQTQSEKRFGSCN